jgi:hypothetical protein
MSLLYFPSQASSDSGGGGQLVLIKKQTASSSSSITFTDGTSDVVFDSTYKTYMFAFESIESDTDATTAAYFQIQASTDDTNYNIALSGAGNRPYRYYGGSSAGNNEFSGVTSTTSFFSFGQMTPTQGLGAGQLFFYDPAQTTHYKQSDYKLTAYGDDSAPHFMAQYGGALSWETTSAITSVQFKMSSGTLESGDITLYGLKTT